MAKAAKNKLIIMYTLSQITLTSQFYCNHFYNQNKFYIKYLNAKEIHNRNCYNFNITLNNENCIARRDFSFWINLSLL